MRTLPWQKSSYCPEGNSCIHLAATPSAIHITETSDPTRSASAPPPDPTPWSPLTAPSGTRSYWGTGGRVRPAAG
ncbi:DUF397 domain-containing protein [Streptomyces sp. NPDC101152]|uniref:DUF397 domain-containing protein n=1 Tax=Streptomyces sp. NPDC101152 TaxID=3366116 RepID=UPI00381214AD